jgi:biopolymer transport protein ExbD
MRRENRLRKRRKGHIVSPEVNVIPLIDISLMLLVVFMVTTPMLQNNIKIDLPHGQAKEAKEQKQELVVYIDKHEKLFFNDELLNHDQLIDRMKKRVATSSDKTVFVKADRGINYGKVIELVDQIKCVGGVKYVALATTRAA